MLAACVVLMFFPFDSTVTMLLIVASGAFAVFALVSLTSAKSKVAKLVDTTHGSVHHSGINFGGETGYAWGSVFDAVRVGPGYVVSLFKGDKPVASKGFTGLLGHDEFLELRRALDHYAGKRNVSCLVHKSLKEEARARASSR